MGFGGIFNSFKFELGDSPSEPIRGEAGDQNGDFRREGDSSNFPQRQLFLNYHRTEIETLSANHDHQLLPLPFQNRGFVKVQTKLSSYFIRK